MKNTLLKLSIILIFLFSSVSILAQSSGDTDGTPTGLEGVDAPAAPINDYILPMILVGIYFGYRVTKRKTSEQL